MIGWMAQAWREGLTLSGNRAGLGQLWPIRDGFGRFRPVSREQFGRNFRHFSKISAEFWAESREWHRNFGQFHRNHPSLPKSTLARR